MSTFPSVLTTYTNPQATDRLNSPSHSAIEQAQNGGVSQVEKVIGLSGDSSVLGTIIGDLRSPNSKGGGHVQGAAFGGTGQTNFAKGDLLVATSASVLAKLAVSGTTGDFLTADTTQATGMKWGPSGSKVFINNSVVTLTRGAASVLTTIFASSIAGSLLGTSNGIRFTGVIPKFNAGTNANDTFTVLVNYGVNSIATFTTVTAGSVNGISGKIQGMIANNSVSSLQLGYVEFTAGDNISGPEAGDPQNMVRGFAYGTSSIDSGVTQNLIIQAKYGQDSTANSILTGLFVVEKIT